MSATVAVSNRSDSSCDNLSRGVRRNIVHAPWFEPFILTVIVINCVFLALEGPNSPQNVLNAVRIAEYIFTAIYVFEIAFKWTAWGLWGEHADHVAHVPPEQEAGTATLTYQVNVIFKQHASEKQNMNYVGYFNDGWNVFDFVVVVFGSILPLFLFLGGLSAASVASLRALRVLRPLRTIPRVPKLKVLVITLINSLEGVASAGFLIFFLMVVFGIMGVQLFSGVLNNQCVIQQPGMDRIILQYKEADQLYPAFCANTQTCLDMANNSATYSNLLPQNGFNNTYVADTTYLICDPNVPNQANGGLQSWNNIFFSLLQVFQVVTLEEWSRWQYDLARVIGYGVAGYFIPLTFVITFFALNLVLAVIVEIFSNSLDFVQQDEDNVAMVDEMDGYMQRRYDGEQRIQQEITSKSRERRIRMLKAQLRRHEQLEADSAVEVETAIKKDNLNRRFKMRFDPRAMASRISRPSSAAATEESSHYEGAGVNIELQELQNEVDAERKAQEGGDIEPRKKRGPMVFTKRVKELQDTKQAYTKEKLDSINHETAFDIWQLAKPVRNRWLDGKPRFVKVCYAISTSDTFESIIIAIIMINTILLAIENPSLSSSAKNGLEGVNYFFTFVYLAELIIKFIGLGPELWFYDRFNLFDAAIVVISIVELILQLSNGNQNESQGALLAFRALRVLRVLRLLHQIESLRVLLSAILDSMEPIFYLVVVLFLFVFMFGVLGVSLFANAVNEASKPDSFTKFTRPWRFDNLWFSMVSSFEVFSGDAWAQMMGDAAAETGTTWASLFFVVGVIVGLMIFMNLFLAVLINRMLNQDEHQVLIDELLLLARRLQKEYQGENEQAGLAKLEEETQELREQRIRVKYLRHEQRQEKHVARSEIRGHSLKIFASDSTVRQLCFDLVSNDLFENAINLCIVVNCVFLAMNGPTVSNDLSTALFYIDIVFTSIFFLEMVIKIIALGLWDEEYAYLKSPWNVVDGLVVIFAILGLAFRNVAFLRGLRAVRPIRIALRVDEVRVVVKALSRSKWQLLNAVLFCFFILFVLAVVGVHLFSGKFGRCVQIGFPFDLVLLDNNQPSPTTGLAVSKVACEDFIKRSGKPYVWLVPKFNFDNVGPALLTMFKISTITNWFEELSNGMAIVSGTDNGLRPWNTPLSALYFMLCVLVGGFFVLNVIITVVVDSFNRIKTEEDRSALMSREQAMWVRKARFESQFPLKDELVPPDNETQLFFFNIVTHPYFDPFVVFLIVLNTLFMMTEFYDQPAAWGTGLAVLEIIFVVFYSIEALFKIIGLGWEETWPEYFNDGWNWFDFIIVIVSIIGLAIGSSAGGSGAAGSAVRLLRVLRVFRLLKRFPLLRALFLTLVYATPSLVNIGSLLFVIFFIWGIVGMELFGKVWPNDGYGNYTDYDSNEGLSDSVNFQTFGGALLILYRTATNDNWSSVFLAAAAEDNCPDFIKSGSDRRRQGPGFDYQCGSIGWAVFYFVSFGIFGTLIMINLFIAVILDTYRDNVEIETKIQQLEPLHQFRDTWKDVDKHKTGKVSAEVFIQILKKNPLLVGLMLEALGLRLNKDEYDAQLLDEDAENRLDHNDFIGPAGIGDESVEVTDDHINAIMESRRLRILCKLKNRGLLEEFWRVKYDDALFAIASLIVGPEFRFFEINEAKFTPIYDWWAAGFEDEEDDDDAATVIRGYASDPEMRRPETVLVNALEGNNEFATGLLGDDLDLGDDDAALTLG